MPTRTDLAWLAGIIDGEGTVSLSHGGAGSPHLRITIYNGAPPIIEKIDAICADLGLTPNRKWDRRAKPCMSFLFGTHAVLALYPLVRPFLVRQVDQLDAAVAFMAPLYVGGRQRIRWTDEQRTAWEVLRGRFHNIAAA